MEMAIAIISLIAGVLNIILFFKIWGMTSNIYDIKEVLLATNIKHVDIKVGDIVVHREFNDVLEVIELVGDKEIKCKALTSNNEFTLSKDMVFVVNQK